VKWFNERQGVTIGLFAFAVLMLFMARENPKLWDVKLFEVIFQAVVLTGLLNMVAAFHFASNKGSETARENTGKAFDAITAVTTGQAPHAGPTGTDDDPIKTEVVNSEDNPAHVQETKP
jgi:hypothetical protein